MIGSTDVSVNMPESRFHRTGYERPVDCALALESHAEVRAAGFGDQVTVTNYYSPVDFYNIAIEELHDYDDYQNE